MNRRAFLASLGLAPLVARSFFDMGSAWAKHDSGLLVPDSYDVWLLPKNLLTGMTEQAIYIGKSSELLPIAGHPVKSIESVYLHDGSPFFITCA